ncbi:MAG: dihydroorotate dehydrogenase electron transfer subunit [Lachnospiraceae bacterium]|nr:dihydroorotate dehydrogenase electron transfer subunit [Lachnospiraceae bacterium]
MKTVYMASVVSQNRIGTGIFDLWLHVPEIAEAATCGQFVALYSRDHSRLLPRPLSLCEVKDGQIRLVYRVAGAGTEEFSGLAKGDSVRVMGPLGNGFPMENRGRALIIGGGIGIPPMLMLAERLPGEKQILLGYRDERFLQDEFQAYGPVHVATEDGSFGTTGNVMDIIREKKLEADVLYACGPKPMLRAIKEYAAEKNILAFISMEERMACGVGACLGCVCQTNSIDGHSNVKNKRICKDGPVFEAGGVEL